jgi:hypothetical protein
MCSPWLTHMLLSKDLSQRLAAYMDVSSLLNTVVCSRQLYRECGNSCAVWSAHSQCKPLSFKPDCAVDAITRATALDAYKAIKAIQSSDSVAQLESLLFLHPAAQLSAGVARSGLLRLNMLVMDGAVERVSAWQLGFAEKCVWLMRQHVQSAECLVEGLQCLVGLGRPVFRNNSSVDSAAGGTLLVTPATTMSYTLSAAPIFDNCSMLGDVVFEAMRLHPRNPEVVATALRAATNLCLSYKQRCWLLSAGLMDMVLWAVIEYSTDARVVERCLSCAINLSARSSDNSGCHWKVSIYVSIAFQRSLTCLCRTSSSR